MRNKKIEEYINKLYPDAANDFESEVSDYLNTEENYKKEEVKKQNKSIQKGGGLMIDFQQIQNKPNGGFPPIYLLSKDDLENFSIKKREFATVKNSISIKDILKNRKLI